MTFIKYDYNTVSVTASAGLVVSYFVCEESMIFIVVSPCDDGVMNGNETDVDCGGRCQLIRKCDDGLRCNNGSDCNSVVCILNICRGTCDYLWCKVFEPLTLSCSSYLQRYCHECK